MQGRQEAVFETLCRMQRFLDDNRVTLEAVNQSGARKSLDDIVTQIASHAVTQVGGRRTAEGETAKQQSLRLTLRYDHMQPIAVIAGQKLREKQEFKLLRLPRWNVKGVTLSAVAHDMANAAEKYTDLFVQEGLPSDFVSQLRTATLRLDESIGVRGQSQGQRAGATEGLKAETKRARVLIRLLDSLVRPKLGVNDELLREWKLASHIKRARTVANPTSNAQPSATPPAVTVISDAAPAPTAAAA